MLIFWTKHLTHKKLALPRGLFILPRKTSMKYEFINRLNMLLMWKSKGELDVSRWLPKDNWFHIDYSDYNFMCSFKYPVIQWTEDPLALPHYQNMTTSYRDVQLFINIMASLSNHLTLILTNTTMVWLPKARCVFLYFLNFLPARSKTDF